MTADRCWTCGAALPNDPPLFTEVLGGGKELNETLTADHKAFFCSPKCNEKGVMEIGGYGDVFRGLVGG